MNVITVSREYGAGGGEVARKLAEALGWHLLDRELLHRAAAVEQVPDAELEALDEQAVRMVDRFRLHPPHQRYMHGLTQAVKEAVARGHVVLVGRGARDLVGPVPGAFHLRLVAPLAWRAERMARLQGWSVEEAQARCAAVDQTRARFTQYFFGEGARRSSRFDLVANTGRVPPEDVAAAVAAFVRGEPPGQPPAGRRVLTLAREAGAEEEGLVPALAARLGLRVVDRAMLEREAARLGLTAAELAQIDEPPPGVAQRLQPGSLLHRYLDLLGKLIREAAEAGDVLILGRGGSRFLADDPRAFHARWVSPAGRRVRWLMARHWVREDVARRMVSEQDGRRERFYRLAFNVDWAGPLEYHATVNTGRLGVEATSLVALLANRHWAREDRR